MTFKGLDPEDDFTKHLFVGIKEPDMGLWLRVENRKITRGCCTFFLIPVLFVFVVSLFGLGSDDIDTKVGAGIVVLFAWLFRRIASSRVKSALSDLQQTENIEIIEFHQMTGTQFEIFLVNFFKLTGYEVTHTGGKGDFGADLVIETEGEKIVVQAKCYSSVVRHDAVQQIVAAKAHYKASGAMVVTTSSFSSHAVSLANSNEVTLWDSVKLGEEVMSLLRDR